MKNGRTLRRGCWFSLFFFGAHFSYGCSQGIQSGNLNKLSAGAGQNFGDAKVIDLGSGSKQTQLEAAFLWFEAKINQMEALPEQKTIFKQVVKNATALQSPIYSELVNAVGGILQALIFAALSFQDPSLVNTLVAMVFSYPGDLEKVVTQKDLQDLAEVLSLEAKKIQVSERQGMLSAAFMGIGQWITNVAVAPQGSEALILAFVQALSANSSIIPDSFTSPQIELAKEEIKKEVEVKPEVTNVPESTELGKPVFQVLFGNSEIKKILNNVFSALTLPGQPPGTVTLNFPANGNFFFTLLPSQFLDSVQSFRVSLRAASTAILQSNDTVINLAKFNIGMDTTSLRNILLYFPHATGISAEEVDLSEAHVFAPKATLKCKNFKMRGQIVVANIDQCKEVVDGGQPQRMTLSDGSQVFSAVFGIPYSGFQPEEDLSKVACLHPQFGPMVEGAKGLRQGYFQFLGHTYAQLIAPAPASPSGSAVELYNELLPQFANLPYSLSGMDVCNVTAVEETCSQGKILSPHTNLSTRFTSSCYERRVRYLEAAAPMCFSETQFRTLTEGKEIRAWSPNNFNELSCTVNTVFKTLTGSGTVSPAGGEGLNISTSGIDKISNIAVSTPPKIIKSNVSGIRHTQDITIYALPEYLDINLSGFDIKLILRVATSTLPKVTRCNISGTNPQVKISGLGEQACLAFKEKCTTPAISVNALECN